MWVFQFPAVELEVSCILHYIGKTSYAFECIGKKGSFGSSVFLGPRAEETSPVQALTAIQNTGKCTSHEKVMLCELVKKKHLIL